MTSTGLSTAQQAQIVAVLARHPDVHKAVLFGSRAKGQARPDSDVDLALVGPLDDLALEHSAMELDELPTPLRFDVVSADRLANPALKAHIDRVGVVCYRREPIA